MYIFLHGIISIIISSHSFHHDMISFYSPSSTFQISCHDSLGLTNIHLLTLDFSWPHFSCARPEPSLLLSTTNLSRNILLSRVSSALRYYTCYLDWNLTTRHCSFFTLLFVFGSRFRIEEHRKRART